MIPHGVEVFVGLDPIDLRWGYHRLTGLVAERMGCDARSGALFVFFGKRRDAMKVLFVDHTPVDNGTGVCRFYKCLDAGTFRIPSAHIEDTTVVEREIKIKIKIKIEINEREFDALQGGIDIQVPAATLLYPSAPYRNARLVFIRGPDKTCCAPVLAAPCGQPARDGFVRTSYAPLLGHQNPGPGAFGASEGRCSAAKTLRSSG